MLAGQCPKLSLAEATVGLRVSFSFDSFKIKSHFFVSINVNVKVNVIFL